MDIASFAEGKSCSSCCNHGCRNWEHRGLCVPSLLKDLGPFAYNLVAFLENFENAIIKRNIHISGHFRRSFQTFVGVDAPDPLANSLLGTSKILNLLHHAKMFCRFTKCFTPRKSAQSHFQQRCQGDLQSMCPYYCIASYVPGYIYANSSL